MLTGGVIMDMHCTLHLQAQGTACVDMQERSKLQLLAAGAELVDPELELVWNWNIHVRKQPVCANAEVRPPRKLLPCLQHLFWLLILACRCTHRGRCSSPAGTGSM